MNNPIISIRNLDVAYETKEVIKNACFDIFPNDFIGIIGPNGGGKTTLVKAVLKSIPYKGSVIYSKEIEKKGYRKIGYLPQITRIDRQFPINVLDVVLSGLQSQKGIFGRFHKDDRIRAMELLSMTNIEGLSHNNINDLSGGEFQRVMLCRALIADPILLILDEPNNFVDNNFEKELYTLLKELNKKISIMIVSHDIGTITSHVKSIICVNKNVYYHDSNQINSEQLKNYNCPLQTVYHGDIPHTVLEKH
ncbi:MAG: metal ABC transporter ATP-binding protein [Rikenellaceae bacterium]|nr:metal ABC transporter ATP-binding protein [Rikenellaceae bacterium]